MGCWGKTERDLNNIGIFTVNDLLHYDHEFLLRNWGRRAYELYSYAGNDNSVVQTDQETKSMGEETTLDEDTRDLDVLKKFLREFSLALGRRMASRDIKCRTITIKVKYNDFKTITRSITLSLPTSSSHTIYQHSRDMLANRVPLLKPVRLIGVQVSNLIYPDEPIQISFI